MPVVLCQQIAQSSRRLDPENGFTRPDGSGVEKDSTTCALPAAYIVPAYPTEGQKNPGTILWLATAGHKHVVPGLISLSLIADAFDELAVFCPSVCQKLATLEE